MKRVIWHWTGGTNRVSDLDRKHYHEIIDGEGKVHAGFFEPEDNLNPKTGQYAAHTLNTNTGSIGIAVAGMFDAQERPFSWGKYPIKQVQIDKLVERTRFYNKKYGIPVSRTTNLSHAEVEPNLGIKQRGKWDIAVLPGMSSVKNPVEIGDKLRKKVMDFDNKDFDNKDFKTNAPKPQERTEGFWGWLKRILGWN